MTRVRIVALGRIKENLCTHDHNAAPQPSRCCVKTTSAVGKPEREREREKGLQRRFPFAVRCCCCCCCYGGSGSYLAFIYSSSSSSSSLVLSLSLSLTRRLFFLFRSPDVGICIIQFSSQEEEVDEAKKENQLPAARLGLLNRCSLDLSFVPGYGLLVF